jgi:hypothetical protein
MSPALYSAVRVVSSRSSSLSLSRASSSFNKAIISSFYLLLIRSFIKAEEEEELFDFAEGKF